MSKVNQMLLEWKPGDIHGLDWFKKRSIDQRLAYSYYESGYLEKIGPGVFSRKGDEINPYAVVRFIHDELKIKAHISGRSALEISGHGHYVSLGDTHVLYMTSYEDRSIPNWLRKLESGNKFELRFKKSSLIPKENYLITNHDLAFDVKISCRELAILELIEMLDLSSTLETSKNYAESLHTLRSNTVQKILEECQSVKVKRVFLYLAEKLNLPFFKDINFKKINLGSGKRVIVKNGEYNKKYQITVDKDYGENPF